MAGSLLALAAVVAGGFWFATRDDGSKTASTTAATTSPESETTEGTETTTSETTTAETTVDTTSETTVAETTTSEPGSERADEYFGLAVETLEQASMPAGVEFVGGALVAPDYFHSVSQVSDSAGEMFWLLRPRGTEPDGSLVDWEVLDAVRMPDGGLVDDIVVLGEFCRSGRTGGEVPVAAVFRPSLEDFVSDSRAAWFVNTGPGRFEWIDGVVSCPNPAAGI